MENIDSGVIINLLTVLAIAAAVAGFMAGLLGVGGGIIMVPALYYAFSVLDFDIVTRMHLSVGTSLAIIIPTSIISTRTHMEYNAVDFKMVKSFGIFILLGVITGTFLAVNLKTPTLVLFFSIFAFIVGLFFIFVREKLMENPKKISNFVKNISGVIIGFISVPLARSILASYVWSGFFSAPPARSIMTSYPWSGFISAPPARSFLVSYVWSGFISAPHACSILASCVWSGFISAPLASSFLASCM